MLLKNELYDLATGGALGKQYTVLAFLGEGYEGEVYKVEEKTTEIVRAAKLFYKKNGIQKRPHVEYAKRLHSLRTCPIVIQYHHQDRVRIKGQDVDFLVSEFVDGEVLNDYITRMPQKRLPPFEALHLFYAIVKGVEQIHLLNEYHGDIHSDNIIVKRQGLKYSVHLIDLLHLGKPTKARIQEDVVDLAQTLHEIIGGTKYYQKMPKHIKEIINGRKKQLIQKKFKTASDLRIFLENYQSE
jgi:serine/threonine protein kinase